MDRISYLHEFIVHHILSFCNTLELVRMSVLSKTWFNLTASFPVLDFTIHDFTSRESFFKYVEYTTSRFCNQNVTAHTFKLITNLQEPAELDIVNRCLDQLLLKNCVKELVIDFTDSLYDQKYRLPNILLSVSALESLTICNCELPSSLMVDAVKFKSLIYLQLKEVHLDDEVIKHLATSCPLLQVFQVIACHGFKRFCVYGHQNLQNVWIEFDTQVERIDIEATNLSYIAIIKRNRGGPPQMNLASCKKLNKVFYCGHLLPNSNGFTDLLAYFPFVKNLVLFIICKCNNLKLSSHSLRTLVLYSHIDLEEIKFSTPNLVSFSYTSSRSQLMSMVEHKYLTWFRDSTHLKACMHCYPDGCRDTLWFHKLRRFLDNKNGFKVFNLYIQAIYSQKFTKLESLKAIELPPYELEHVVLQLESHEKSLAHIAFVDAVLWCCRPRSLTLRSSFPLIDFEDVVKFTCKKLLEQEDQGHTNIQIVWTSSSEAQKHSRDLKSLSMALPCEGKTITFIKEQGLKERAGRWVNLKSTGLLRVKIYFDQSVFGLKRVVLEEVSND